MHHISNLISGADHRIITAKSLVRMLVPVAGRNPVIVFPISYLHARILRFTKPH
jgi:hypothetical protein